MTEANAFQPVDSLQMMAFIIKRCDASGIPVNITKLQKLMYCCYGAVLAMFGKRLTDEQPVALQYGPVFLAALKSAKFFKLESFRGSNVADAEALPAPVLDLVNQTIAHFGRFSASDLSRWSHAAGGPWSRASLDGEFLGVPLSDADVREYFATKVFKRAVTNG